MKVAILAGGLGTRFAEETETKPKPMIEVGGRPILWHIMKGYAHHGFNDFVVALGYKGDTIKRYMLDYSALQCNLTVHTRGGVVRHGAAAEDWAVKLVDTGLATNTGGRIRRLRQHVGESTFMLTWGDGVSDLDLKQLLAFHRAHGKLATVTAVRPPARFGHLVFDGDRVVDFSEKPQTAEGWINGAFFVLEPAIFDYIDDDDGVSWERGPMERLAREGQLMAYRHEGFWQCMDTLRDKKLLERLWAAGDPPWRLWDDDGPAFSHTPQQPRAAA